MLRILASTFLKKSLYAALGWLGAMLATVPDHSPIPAPADDPVRFGIAMALTTGIVAAGKRLLSWSQWKADRDK